MKKSRTKFRRSKRIRVAIDCRSDFGTGRHHLLDYLKGVLTRRVLREVAKLGRKHSIPVISAPKDAEPEKYARASVLLPNFREFTRLVHHRKNGNGNGWIDSAALSLIEKPEFDALLVTRGKEGMTLFERTSGALSRQDIPSVSQAVFDVTGAGDTSIAVFALCLAAGATRTRAAQLANVAAGIVVSKRGTALVGPSELLERTCEVAENLNTEVRALPGDRRPQRPAGEKCEPCAAIKVEILAIAPVRGEEDFLRRDVSARSPIQNGSRGALRSVLRFNSDPTVLYALAFGALNNVLVPMFVEAKAHGNREEIVLLWNCMIVTAVGGLALLVMFYYPVLLAFPLLFRRLAWLDSHQVASIFLAFSLYQIVFIAVATKNCFLFAWGPAVLAQTGVLCGWMVSLALLSRFHGSENLARIPLCLLAGNVIALFFPNLGPETFFYRPGLLKLHTVSVVSRTVPITAGTSVGWLEPAIDGVIASTMKQGSLTIYYFFGRVMFYIATAIFSGYIQPVSKYLSELAGEGALA